MNQQTAVLTGGTTEYKLRRELAAAFRIAHHLGWNIDTLNHISLRLPGTDTFLLNPVGLGWDEITASSLVTVDFQRNVLSHTGAKVPGPGYNFHSGILRTRPDINCVMHVHEMAGTILSAIDHPLTIITQGGCTLYGEVGYHAFEGLAQEADEVPRMLADLGDVHTLIMLNHGQLSVGATLGEAFGFMRMLIAACTVQIKAMATGAKLRPVPSELQAQTKAQVAAYWGNGPREDNSWAYWLRLAERLDPSFAD
jgi:ribulose-5-phosphate 4-epimerase/fuculose-1-phosphate aldolase